MGLDGPEVYLYIATWTTEDDKFESQHRRDFVISWPAPPFHQDRKKNLVSTKRRNVEVDKIYIKKSWNQRGI